MTQPLRVLVESRHDLTRAGLTHLIGFDPRRAQVLSAGQQPTARGHDVVVYDLCDRNAHEELALRRLIHDRARIVVLRQGSCPETAQSLLAMGAADVVSMDISGDELLDSIERAAGGHDIAPVAHRVRDVSRAQLATGLTDREIEVLGLIATGLSNEEIATELYVSINTLKTYIRSAYKRIGADTRSQAVIWALRHGIAARPLVLLPR